MSGKANSTGKRSRKKSTRKTTKKTKPRKDKQTFGKINTSDVETRVVEIAESTGRTEQEVLDEMFGDGWLTVMIEEGGRTRIDASQLYAKKPVTKDKASECERLRNTFAPIASCIKYARDQILAGGIEALISDPTNKHQKDVKERITNLIDDIHQDRYTRGLYTLMAIMVDLALTTGIGAAEICFDKENFDFWDYATISEEQKQMIEVLQKKEKDGTKTAEYILIETKEPSWSDLKGIVRLKISHNARKRFKLYRDPKTWQAKYWSVDEAVNKDNEAMTTQGIRISLRTFKQEKPNAVYMHPWQVFWLVLNRKNYSEMGDGIISEVLTSALLLEKILKAVGEGIHRAGNKKYFIICGTEKRQWSGPYIRNMLQQLKEASQKNWSTIPAPAGFDIKDIGGDVFEADKVVNYFKKIVARGIGVPAKVLGVEVRDEPHYGFEVMREQLRMAIKYQLFQTHLWCNLGKKAMTKQGGSTTPIYIPNPRFKDETLLSFPERIELLFKGFNVANPFNPLIKLKAEREYCKLMGWDEVLLPTQEQLKKELEELEKAKLKEPITPVKEKRQGEPEPQTKERQEKRLEGMTDKHPEKDKSRPQGKTRIPKEVQEAVPETVVEPQPVEVREVEVVRKIVTPTDEIMMELAKERTELARKQKELADLQTKFAEEDNKRKQRKIQKEIDKVNVEIDKKKMEIEKMKKETEKIETETDEIIKTHEEKRKTMKEIQEQVKKEKEFMGDKEEDGGEE